MSIAGLLGWTDENEKNGFAKKAGKAIGTAFLGNTFSGISDTITHVATLHLGKAYADFALGGTAQGLPIGSTASSKGIVGVITEAGVDAVTKTEPLLSLTAPVAEVAAEGMAGPVGAAKLLIDFSIYAGSAAYCYSHP